MISLNGTNTDTFTLLHSFVLCPNYDKYKNQPSFACSKTDSSLTSEEHEEKSPLKYAGLIPESVAESEWPYPLTYPETIADWGHFLGELPILLTY